MNSQKTKWNYFQESEVKNLDSEFVALLDHARHISGVPYIITSGFRTPEDNFVVGGVDGSAHIQGLAVDLLVKDSRTAGLILKGLYAVGLNRIGVYYKVFENKPYWTHIHVDNDKTKDQNVCWLKVE